MVIKREWLYSLIPCSIILVLVFLFFFIKRHRGHGYFLSKFSAFTRIRFDHLEQRRQTYSPASKICRCHAEDSSSHIEPSLTCPHRSPTLYMSFAGAAMIVGGVRTTEWRGSMRELHRDTNNQFDALFLTDPAQCFYLQDPNYRWQGLIYYRNLVQLYSTLYKRVILIGASLGGSMVCMCADLATISIALNPILDPTLLGLAWRIMGAFCPARQAQVIREQVRINMEKIHAGKTGAACALHIHWSQLSAADQRQAHRIVGGGQTKQPVQTKCLTTVFNYDGTNEYLSSLAGVHIWFHQSARHALAMHLKRTGQLIQLLKRHLEVTLEDRTDQTSRTDVGQEEEEERHSVTVHIPLLADVHHSSDGQLPVTSV